MISSQRLLQRRLASHASTTRTSSSSQPSRFRCLHSQTTSRQSAIPSCTAQPRPFLLSSHSTRPSVSTPISSLYSNRHNRRHLHYIQTLPNQDEYYNNGIAGVYSANGFDLAWDKWQNHLLNNLNRLVGGTEHEDKTPLQIAIMTSRSSEHASIFNYASSAHNNHFFFEGMTSIYPPPVIPKTLETMIVNQFGNMEAFKETLLTTAEMVFSNAFVWVVLDGKRDLRILVTYNSGTPYSHIRRHAVDFNTTTMGSEDFTGLGPQARLGEKRNVSDSLDIIDSASRYGGGGGFGGESESERSKLTPLLCVNVWQYAYMVDWGVSNKRGYLEEWFKAINWAVVVDRMPVAYHTPGRRMLGN